MTLLEALALGLLATHFGVPLAYYYYAKHKWLPKPWNIKVDPNYTPRVTIIIPTYNEANLIEEKLNDVYRQEYPRDKLEVIVVDSASTDGTPEKVRAWIKQHPDLQVKLIEEPVRRGKANALNEALDHSTGEVVVITDVDAKWQSENSLKEAVKWLSDPHVGAVSCLKKPANPDKTNIESGYREYYNIMRLAESKAWATPIFHGELATYKKDLLLRIGGFPLDIGADDSYTASKIASMGYRSITPETLWCTEKTPSKEYHKWRIRRAQHLIQHFTKIMSMKPKTPRQFRPIIYVESYLHLINPWILLAAIILLSTSVIAGNYLLATVIAILGFILLLFKPFKVWITTQIYLIIASIRNIWTKEIIWEKQAKTLDLSQHSPS